MKRYQYTKRDEDRIPTREHRVHPANPDILLPLRRGWRRLGNIDYRDPDCVCLVTCCTRDKAPFFESPRRIRVVRDALLGEYEARRFQLLAYTLLPDHAHVVLAPGRSRLSVGRIVGGWKSLVARRLWPTGVDRTPWQRDYDDRVLRSDEKEGLGLQRMIAYVLNNPVRKGFVQDWRHYPYSGCFVDLDSL